MDLIEKINTHLSTHPLFYVTRDVERALSLEGIFENYYIITNQSPLSENIKERVKLLCVGANGRSPNPLSTRELLENEDVKKFIAEKSSGRQPNILVFKSTKQIERTCVQNGWKLLNPSAELAEQIENKISQTRLLAHIINERQDLPKPLLSKEGTIRIPKFQIVTVKEISFSNTAKKFGLPFITQFNRAHTGQGTHVIENNAQLDDLRSRFPNREAKIAEFIEGFVFTINICVGDSILVGNPSLQITGQPELTAMKYATVGNDWTAARNVQLTTGNLQLIGRELAQVGWRGLFGVDYILKDNELYLIEINARQAASVVYESYLQMNQELPTIMHAHIEALLNITPSSDGVRHGRKINGSQIFLRNRQSQPITFSTDLKVGEYAFENNSLTFIKDAHSITEVDPNHFFIIPKTSSVAYKPNEELVRVQSRKGMVDAKGRLLPVIQALAKELCKKL